MKMRFPPGDNTGKNLAHWFFAKQKPNVSKTRKCKLRVWGNNTYYVKMSSKLAT